MSAVPVADDRAQGRRTGSFRSKYDAPRLAPEAQRRQGRISSEAFLALGRDEALRFLNDMDDRLGGRPLALATASEEGFARVSRAIRERADRPAGAEPLAFSASPAI